jgi:hypothetical protein
MNIDGKSIRNRLVDVPHGWQALVSLVITSILYSMLAEAMIPLLPYQGLSAVQARYGSLILSGILLTVSTVALLIGRSRISSIAIFAFTSVVTLYLLSGVSLLVLSLPNLHGSQSGLILLRDASIVWVINIIIFAVWYWLLDGGGPLKRRTVAPNRKDFLFPQEAMRIRGWEGWQPTFFSYLFASFHFCSTFGPTDAYVLSRRGKLLVMVQVAISLITLTMILSRAFTIIS